MEEKYKAQRRRTKSINLNIRISPQIKAIMIEQSKEKGQTISEYLRNLVEMDSIK